MPPGDDTTLHVRRAVAGQSASLEWLVARFSPVLLSQAAYRLGPDLRRLYDPEDVVQEVWATALPKLAGLTPRDGRLTPVVLRFLATTVLYRISNLLQKHLQRDAGTPHEIGGSLSQLPAETSRLIQRAVRGESERLLREAIDSLPEPDRQVVLLRGIEQNPLQEVAVLLQLKPNTVTVKYRRALARLRERLPGTLLDELDADA